MQNLSKALFVLFVDQVLIHL